MWPASTRSGAAAWRDRSSRPRSCCTLTVTLPASATPSSCRPSSASACSSASCAHAVAWAVAAADPREIDHVNIHQASLRAMQRAVLALVPLPDIVLVDAFRVPDLPMAQRGVPHGDRRCSAIAAASIIAKVTRDREMTRAARPRSALRLRPAQRLRHRRSSRRGGSVRLFGRAPPIVPAANPV